MGIINTENEKLLMPDGENNFIIYTSISHSNYEAKLIIKNDAHIALLRQTPIEAGGTLEFTIIGNFIYSLIHYWCQWYHFLYLHLPLYLRCHTLKPFKIACAHLRLDSNYFCNPQRTAQLWLPQQSWCDLYGPISMDSMLPWW